MVAEIRQDFLHLGLHIIDRSDRFEHGTLIGLENRLNDVQGSNEQNTGWHSRSNYQDWAWCTRQPGEHRTMPPGFKLKTQPCEELRFRRLTY